MHTVLWDQKEDHNKKDTVTTHKEDDKVNAHHHVREHWPAVCHNAIIHHSIPVLSSEDL